MSGRVMECSGRGECVQVQASMRAPAAGASMTDGRQRAGPSTVRAVLSSPPVSRPPVRPSLR